MVTVLSPAVEYVTICSIRPVPTIFCGVASRPKSHSYIEELCKGSVCDEPDGSLIFTESPILAPTGRNNGPELGVVVYVEKLAISKNAVGALPMVMSCPLSRLAT